MPIPTPSKSEAAVLVERRRPGRVEYANQALISLLRGEQTETAEAEASIEPAILEYAQDLAETDDDLGSAKGILLCLFGGAAIWAVLIGLALTIASAL